MATDGPVSGSAKNDPQSLATAPAIVLRDLYAAIGQALGNAALNAVAAQQQSQIIALAAATQGVATLYSVDTAALGMATKKAIDNN
jgi:hypothetical protein